MALTGDPESAKPSAIWPSSSVHRCLYCRTYNKTNQLPWWSQTRLQYTYTSNKQQQVKLSL
jgi:hypothetical protein